MRSSCYFASLLVLTIVLRISAFSEQAKQNGPQPFDFVALTDPACPVVGYIEPAPSVKEIHVLYFPMGKGASIKDPKSLVANVVFDSGFGMASAQSFPLSRREDGVWQATVPMKDMLPKYAVYWFEDRETKQRDANGGNDFEIPFCDVYGQRDELSVMGEARSYTGALAAYGVDRVIDYARAIDILQSHIDPPLRGGTVISDLWQDKLKVYGDTPDARQKLVAEINQFISDHTKDGFGLMSTMNFVAHQNWIPEETTDALVIGLEGKYPDYNPRTFLLQAQVSREKDKDKRIALEWEVVNKYPDSDAAVSALQQLAAEVKDFGQREKIYQKLRERSPEDAFVPFNLAIVYSEGNKKLGQALSLLDDSEKLLASNQNNKQAKFHYFDSTIKEMRLRIAVLRADLLLRTQRPAEALAALQDKKSQFQSGASYYLLGKVFEANGQKRSAVDAYLEAVVRPSSKDKEANAALGRLWLGEKLGSKQALQQRVEQKLGENFKTAEYVPQLQNQAAPDFEVTTLRGERVNSSQLRGKAIILTFWAPWCGACRPEMRPLQDFQAKHPELVVATVVDDSTDPKELAGIVREKKLSRLRICKVPTEFSEKFNVTGLPDTVVIDSRGQIRVRHLGSMPDVERYLEADLKAIADAGQSNPPMPDAGR